MERAAKGFAVAATIGMFLVLLMGATVTNTGSSEGCGNSWPLCHGQFIPEYAFETMVEYSHRLITAIEGLLILGLAITAFPQRRRYPELRALLPVMIFTLLLQSGMGAWAVKYPQTPAVLATHFGISLVCFASVFLIMRVLWDEIPTSAAASRAVPSSYARLAWATLLWTIVVAYVGAYMRHSGAELACYTWPLCNGSVIPDFGSPGVAVAWSHRLVALIAMVLVFIMERRARGFREQRPDLARAANWASGLIVAQALIGAGLIFSRLSLASTLGHAAFMALLFVALADSVWRATPRRRTVAVPDEPALSGAPAAAR